MHAIDRLTHRADIQDVLYRYARGVDRRDWAAVRACFHDDATDHHGDFKGGIDAFIAWITPMHAQVPFSAHFLGNLLVEFSSDYDAAVETYFTAMLRLDAASEAHRGMFADSSAAVEAIDMEVVGRYLDQFKRDAEGWRIANRLVAFDDVRMRRASTGAIRPGWVAGSRDLSDPVYALRRRVQWLGDHPRRLSESLTRPLRWRIPP